jgi:hypothetical protein
MKKVATTAPAIARAPVATANGLRARRQSSAESAGVPLFLPRKGLVIKLQPMNGEGLSSATQWIADFSEGKIHTASVLERH